MSRILLASMILAAACVPTLGAELSASDIRAMLQAQDARSVVQQLDRGDDASNVWFAVLAHIEAGESEWLDLVPLLSPGTDAGTAEALIITLSRALKTNPAAVLQLIADGQHLTEDICMDNDIEVSSSQVIAFIDEARAAVEAVVDPDLMAARDECLAVLSEARILALMP